MLIVSESSIGLVFHVHIESMKIKMGLGRGEHNSKTPNVIHGGRMVGGCINPTLHPPRADRRSHLHLQL